jgi:hypothetical protein
VALLTVGAACWAAAFAGLAWLILRTPRRGPHAEAPAAGRAPEGRDQPM